MFWERSLLAGRKETDTFELRCWTMITRKLWDSLKYMTNMTPARRSINVRDEGAKANELSDVYCRFAVRDFSQEQKLHWMPRLNWILLKHSLTRIWWRDCVHMCVLTRPDASLGEH